MTQAIGILGGTFDPIHYGHLRSALEISEQLELSAMRFIPCGTPVHRQMPKADARHRLAMIQQAIAGQAGFIADARELARPGPSYTVDTLLSLRAELGAIPFCLVLGTDAFMQLPHWHRWEMLLYLTHLIVLQRPDNPLQLPADFNHWMQPAITTDYRALQHQTAGLILFQSMTQLAISATQIRTLIAAGHSPRYLLPDAVWAYIREHQLYGECPNQALSDEMRMESP